LIGRQLAATVDASAVRLFPGLFGYQMLLLARPSARGEERITL